MAIAWPAGVPQRSERDGFRAEPFKNMRQTEFEGAVRRRPYGVTRIDGITERIHFTYAQMATFRTWFLTTLGGGRPRFDKEVWTDTAWVVRTCQFTGSGYAPQDTGGGVDVVLTYDCYNR